MDQISYQVTVAGSSHSKSYIDESEGMVPVTIADLSPQLQIHHPWIAFTPSGNHTGYNDQASFFGVPFFPVLIAAPSQSTNAPSGGASASLMAAEAGSVGASLGGMVGAQGPAMPLKAPSFPNVKSKVGVRGARSCIS
jgi:hypothetical protein